MYIANQDSRSQANNQPTQPTFVDPSHQAVHGHVPKQKRFKRMGTDNLSIVLVFLIGILIALVVVALFFYKSGSEASYVDTSTYQSVDINVSGQSGGQIYFGQIKTLNSNYIIMDNVFYLQAGTNANDFTLNSLTCALYTPLNQIVIERSQVAFWENLSSKSQIVTDIGKWHTDKLQCAKATDSTSATTPATS